MSTKLVKTKECVYQVSASLNGDEWKKCKDLAIDALAKKINIKGFRKGKAPLSLVQSKIQPADLYSEMTHQGANHLYRQILEEHKIRPFSQPSINIDGITEDEFKCTFTITTFPEVQLGKYKDIQIPLDDFKVEDKEVNEAINKLLDDNAELVLSEGPAKIGDTVVFDFKGYIDGKEFEGGSAQNHSLVLGSNQFVPGFEDQLVGVKPNSKVDVNITFPDQYLKELANKDAKFVCVIHEVKTKVMPKLDDEFAKTLSINGVENLAELKEFERKTLLNKKEQTARETHFNKVLSTIIDNSTISIADAVVEEEVARSKQNLLKELEKNGFTYNQYKELTGATDQSIEDTFKQQSLVNLKRTLVLDKLAQVENLYISQDELNKQYQQLANTYQTDVESIKKMYGQTTAGNKLAENMLMTKIQRFIILNNKPVEKTSKAKKTTKEKETKTADNKATSTKKKKN